MSEQQNQQTQPAYPSLLSRHLERNSLEIGAEAPEEDNYTEDRASTTYPPQEEQGQQEEEDLETSPRRKLFGQERPKRQEVRPEEELKVHPSPRVPEPEQAEDEVNNKENREEEKKSGRGGGGGSGGGSDPYLAVENLDNAYGIDMDTICEFWNSYKKQFIHLKDWHHQQKNTIHWHLQLLIHFHNSLMDNMNLANTHSDSMLVFFKSMMEHEKEYATKMDKYSKSLMPKIKSHPKVQYRQNPSSTNPKDLIPVESAFNRFNLIFAQQQKELTQRKLEFVHFLKTRLCDNIKQINKDVVDRIQRYVPCFSKARKMLDAQEKEVEKAFDRLCIGFNNFESAIFRKDHDTTVQAIKQRLAKPKSKSLSRSQTSKQVSQNALDVAAEAASREAEEISKNRTQKRVGGIITQDGQIEQDVWLLERAYLFTVKIWHDEIIALSKLITTFWQSAIEIEIRRKSKYKEMAIEYFAKNKSQMAKEGGVQSEMTQKLEKYITTIDTQHEVDLLYHSRSFITDQSETCYNKQDMERQQRRFKLASGMLPQDIPPMGKLTKAEFQQELEKIRIERPPKSGLIVTYGKLKRNPGIFSSWKACTAAITRNNYLVLFDNDSDKKPSLHIYLPHYAVSQKLQSASKSEKSERVQLYFASIHQIFRALEVRKYEIRSTLRALSNQELYSWTASFAKICLSYEGL